MGEITNFSSTLLNVINALRFEHDVSDPILHERIHPTDHELLFILDIFNQVEKFKIL